MKFKKIFTLDFLILIQFVGVILFWFLSHNSYKSVILYFSFMIFFCYWILKIVFAKEIIKEDLISSNKKL